MSDDDVGRRLRGQIPEPRHGYWESIHTKLAAIEAAQDFDEGTDTDVALGRQTDMTNTNPPNVSVLPGESRRPSFLFAAAAALVLILGIGAAALISRSGDDGTTELDVAAEPEGSGSVAAPPTGGQTQTQTTPTPVPADDAVSGVEFGDSPSPVGGTVKKAVLSGPETAVMVVCDQGGFEPFLYTDQGTWIGCQG